MKQPFKNKVIESLQDYIVTAYNPKNSCTVQQVFLDFSKALQAQKDYEELGLISFIDTEKDSVVF